VAGVTAYGLLWIAGGNDLIAYEFGVSLNAVTWFMRFAIFFGPVIAFIVARRWALSLQRRDREELLHGYETGVIMRSPDGAYAEIHGPISTERAYRLSAHQRRQVVELPAAEDEHGVRAPGQRKERVRARLSRFWYGADIAKPTRAELEEAHSPADPDHPHPPEGEHRGIETGGQVGGDEFELEGSSRRDK
jgi:ubiquinol-cytochrome c reductase cytochrome b subunit